MGPGSDYLSQISANNDNEQDGGSEEEATNVELAILPSNSNSNRKSPMANVKSALSSVSDKVGKQTSGISSSFSNVSNEVGRRTSGITSGFASVAERGSSGVQSLANNAISGVGQVAKKGTRDLKKTTLGAQKLVKRGTNTLASTGQGLSEIQFFQPQPQQLKNINTPSFTTPKIISANEVAKWIDSQAKSGSEMVESNVKWIDSKAKSGTEMVGSNAKKLVLNFTNKGEYEFGDVTKELINRVASHEVNMQDWILLMKILLALGAAIGPVAQLLPFTFLVEALNVSLEQKVGGKIVETLSKTLDTRLVAALFTTDDKNLIGDVVKRKVIGGVLEFTGKSNYESGDIQRAVQQGQQQDDVSEDMKLLDLEIYAELEEWDRKFVEKIETEEYVGEQAKIMDMKIAMALEECEAISQRKAQ